MSPVISSPKTNPVKRTSSSVLGLSDPSSAQGMEVDTSNFRKVAVDTDFAKKKLKEVYDNYSSISKDLANNIAPMIGSSIGSMASSFVEGIAKIAVSGGSFKSVINGLLVTLAELAIRVGEIAIATGIAISGIKKALQSLNPVAAIAAGVALVALGGIVKASLSKAANSAGKDNQAPGMATGGIVPPGYPNDTYNARLTSGELVIPPKELPNLSGAGLSEGALTRAFSKALAGAQLKARGEDLILIMNSVGSTYR